MEDVAGSIPRKKSAQNGGEQQAVPAVSFIFQITLFMVL